MELLEIANKLESKALAFKEQHLEILQSVLNASGDLQESWSGSNLGHHANIYYEGLVNRPAGTKFSVEWGMEGESFLGLGSVGNWVEYDTQTVRKEIMSRCGNPELNEAELDSRRLATAVMNIKSEVQSVLSLEKNQDEFLSSLSQEIDEIIIHNQIQIEQLLLPKGQLATRDTNALFAGLKVAPHQRVFAYATGLIMPATVAEKLAEATRKAGSHIERKNRGKRILDKIGTNVFIGHGRSPLWRELKEFVTGRLKLPCIEFNHEPVAGVTNIARLSEMLDDTAIAFIVLTAEDDRKDGEQQARMNAIHEVGLFQGRLGFTRTIIMLEKGCTEFSNIQGLGQIRFPSGNIAAAFEEVRAVVEREKLINEN